MNKEVIKFVVRARMVLTSRQAATAKIKAETGRYLDLIDSLPEEQWAENVLVPRMLGVDPDMREWSLIEICEHNAIVNRSIHDVVRSLVTRTPMEKVIDPKRDVMPGAQLGSQAVDAFKQSVEDYLAAVEAFKGLRSTEKKKHPVFGMLTAHSWHVMFGLHLEIHRKQAEVVVERLR